MDALACEEILAEAAVRIRAVGSHAAEQVERIRAEVKAITGEDIVPPWPRKRTAATLVWFDLLTAVQQSLAFLDAVELLRPHMEQAPEQQVGTVLKTVESAESARISELLERCGFFGASSEG